MLTVLAELVTTDVEMRVDARHPSGNLLRNAARAACAGPARNPARRPMRCLTPPTGRLAAAAERVQIRCHEVVLKCHGGRSGVWHLILRSGVAARSRRRGRFV